MEQRIAIISLIEIFIFILFLLSGSRRVKKGTLSDDPFCNDNISILILISYILMQNCDFFSELYFDKHYSVKGYLWFVFSRIRNQTVYSIGGTGPVILSASAVFWFAVGIYTYRRLKTRKTIPSKAGIIRVCVAVFLYPVVNALAVYACNYRKIDSLEMFWHYYGIYSSVVFIVRCFRMVPVLIFLLILSWFFIKVIRKELLGIVLISASILFLFTAESASMKLIGGMNFIFFPIGLLAAKYNTKITEYLKRRYKLLAVISAVAFVITAVICNNSKLISGKNDEHFAIFTLPAFLLSISAVVLIFLLLLKLDIVTGPKKLISSATFEIVWLTLIPYWYDRNSGLIFLIFPINYVLVIASCIIAVLIVCLITKKSPRDYLKKKETS